MDHRGGYRCGPHIFAAIKLMYMPQRNPMKLRKTIRFSTGTKLKLTIDAIGHIL